MILEKVQYSENKMKPVSVRRIWSCSLSELEIGEPTKLVYSVSTINMNQCRKVQGCTRGPFLEGPG